MDTEDTFENGGYNLTEHPVVSTLDTMVYWREFLKGLLPESSHGIVVVFENACTVSFTYQIL
jgi:hypothetical protein